MSGLVSWLGLGLGSVLGLVLGLIILGTLSRYYCAHSITPCFNRSVAGLDIGYVPAGPRAFFWLSGQFGPQQFIFCWPAGPVTFISVVNTFTTCSVDLSRARGFLIRNLPSPS